VRGEKVRKALKLHARVSPTDPELAELRQKIESLESELAQTRLRLATKEREVRAIHASRAWGFVQRLRTLKQHSFDPILGFFGITWPRRRAAVVAPATPAIIPPAKTYDIVCFSTCDWDERFQRPQQLMLRFAEAGHRVFYISQQFRDDGPSSLIVAKRENVYEVTLRGPRLDVYAHALRDSARDALFEGLDALRRKATINVAAMFVHLPFWWPLAREARERFGWPVLYDCMDLHTGFATVRQAMVAQEDEMLSGADVVIVSSAALEQQARRKRDNVLVLRNGCDFEHFAKTPRANNARPVIGYYGAIADWFDAALVADLAERRADWDFVLVGSTYNGDLSRLAHLDNVSLPGEEAYETLPEWLGRFDVAIIPFKRTPLTEATNPVKIYEMLAAGKPIVSVPIPEVAALAPLVRLASNVAEFEREITAALLHDVDASEERRAFARGETWQHRFEVLRAETGAALVQSA
jgi:glycosyltransferase involved in cell wall biosynthesis